MFDRSKKGEHALLIQPHFGKLEEDVLEEFTDLARSAGAGIAIAFVATIYGVGFANLLYLPIANRLRAFHYHYGLYQEMTLEGLLAIAHGENGQQVERRLRAYLKGE